MVVGGGVWTGQWFRMTDTRIEYDWGEGRGGQKGQSGRR